MLKPTGFWSYTGTDDTASRGRLSRLRLLLADELQAKIGREPRVQIFQDVAAIPYGANWEKEIRRALDQSSFLIPIITPAFLHSEWCCREVTHFRARQAALGRDDLVFPVHYLDVGAFETVRRHECHDPGVLDHLRTHQWVDFRRLRLLPAETDVLVAQKLDEVADAICAAMYRTDPGVPSTVGVPQVTPAIISPVADAPSDDIPPGGTALPAMVQIPAGRFTMGVPEAESAREQTADGSARPQHTVTFRRGFYLGKYPVTRGQFAAFVADAGYRSNDEWRKLGLAQTDSHPVVNVSAIDAGAYARWVAGRTGAAYRLPSEAEWEYAARAGTETARFWGDTWDGAANYLNTNGEGTSPVGSLRPNGFGLYDMLGNVWEWNADHWHADYQNAPTDGSAWTNGGDSSRRVLRGGAWNDLPRSLRAGVRGWIEADFRNGDVGFRLARTL